MKHTKVLLLFGGQSAEHEVAISSARNVFAAIDDATYDVSLCYISKSGQWYLLSGFDDDVSGNGHPRLLPVLGDGKLVADDGSESIEPDVILPILHGPGGEDGTVQGLARLLNVPIVGCGVASSALCMDKAFTKQLLASSGIAVAPYKVYYAYEARPMYEDVQNQLGEAMFVKPANMGSSVGVSKATNASSFDRAVEQAFEHDNKILVEQAIEGRELEVAAMGNAHNVQLSAVGEIKPDREFYSYESKYDDASTTEVVIPAELDDKRADEILGVARRAYHALDCAGMARIDFFLSHSGELYVGEINTIPGFTNISMYPKLWQHAGLHYPELIQKLITLALE